MTKHAARNKPSSCGIPPPKADPAESAVRRDGDRRTRYDFAVVGAGIVGLACARAAAARGARVIVFDRDPAARGASARNFGLILSAGLTGHLRRLALRSLEIWEELRVAADIPIVRRGLLIAARWDETLATLDAYARGRDGEGCEMLSPRRAGRRVAGLRAGALRGALWSPRELRMESREALPRFAAFLRERCGVHFATGVAVRDVSPPRVETGAGAFFASRCAVCPGGDLLSLFADRFAGRKLRRCKLQMLRFRPRRENFRLGATVMSDLSVARYPGFSRLPECAALQARLRRERTDELAAGVHMIAAPSADGSLVIGDSHEYGASADPFLRAEIEEMILQEFRAIVAAGAGGVCERWAGFYPSRPGGGVLTERPHDRARVVVVAEGVGASIALALGEDVADDLLSH